MKAELRERILAYNRAMAQRKEKAEDMDVIATALLALPPGQLKKLLTPEVLAVLDKYAERERKARDDLHAMCIVLPGL